MIDRSKNPASNTLTAPHAGDGKSKRGKLRIFLGYAAGVGKTYAMLEAALSRRAEGVDVVVGYVETHHRPEINSLLDGLEIIPHRETTYRGITLNEMDVDRVLARQPQLVLVDELAHTNVPDSRHPRRYQDVEELLDAGIHVYTTVNVQHIESLNDVVAQITGITVNETVPDYLFDMADQIELIDILPEDLLRRLDEGKVYVPEQAERALRKFFRPGNLTALRELAMRQTARRVDHQMRAYMQTRDIPGPWAASDRLLVCISANPISARLVRTGCRLAQELDIAWYVVYVEAPSRTPLDHADRARLNETMKLAESLGARVNTITGTSVADALLYFARHNNITKIIIGQPLRSRWQELLQGSIVNALIRQNGEIDIYVINSGVENSAASTVSLIPSQHDLPAYLEAAVIVLMATLAGKLVNTVTALNPANLVMFYLLAVVVVALRLGYGPSVMTAFASVIAFNFFFVPPQYTFRVADAQYLLTFLGLFSAGMAIASLASRARNQTEAARQREQETAQLYSLSRELSATVDREVIVRQIVRHTQQTFECEAALYLPVADGLRIVDRTDAFQPEKDDHHIAAWAYEHGQSAGKGTDTIPGAAERYVPMGTAQRVIGVLVLSLKTDLSLEQQRLLDAFATQSALALEAVQLGEEAQQASLLREKEKLQTVVLNSISHDLRTPLVSITGTLSSLLDSDAHFDENSRRDLLMGAYSEAERLNRLVGNLLDMSRLESGSMRLNRELYDLSEIIGVARSHLREQLRHRQIIIHIPDNLPMIPVDLILIAQVFVNLLDNAMKYSEPDTPIEISASQVNHHIQITVADRGVGIPESELPHIFEKFYRASTVHGQGGSGLGLSICQGIVEAHGGSIWAKKRPEGGTCFIINLPLNLENRLR
ncbi:MAG: sensor histidine kinase KdpD [Anaerolineae bacterium]|nr:sensor histidine kinase KdpD [Anaerolineae bacterium]